MAKYGCALRAAAKPTFEREYWSPEMQLNILWAWMHRLVVAPAVEKLIERALLCTLVRGLVYWSDAACAAYWHRFLNLLHIAKVHEIKEWKVGLSRDAGVHDRRVAVSEITRSAAREMWQLHFCPVFEHHELLGKSVVLSCKDPGADALVCGTVFKLELHEAQPSWGIDVPDFGLEPAVPKNMTLVLTVTDLNLVDFRRQCKAMLMLCTCLPTQRSNWLLAGFEKLPGGDLTQDSPRVVYADAQAAGEVEVPEILLRLNLQQAEAVRRAVTSALSLVQGPPGTGKTTTIVRIVVAQCRATRRDRRPVLVVTHSNNNVDELVVLLKGAGLSVAVPGKVTLQELTGAEVWVTTASGAATMKCGVPRSTLCQQPFAIVVDEAAMHTEPELLVPLEYRDGFHFSRTTLVGDQQQLPPLVRSERAQWLKQSLLERLMKWGCDLLCLTECYRMPQSLLAFPSKWWYHDELHSSKRAAWFPAGFRWPDSGFAFVDVTSPEAVTPDGSIMNEEQVKVVSTIVSNLDCSSQDVVVLTPYRAQMRQLKRALSLKKPGVRVATVDGSQGLESEFVILNTVRCNPRGDLGFVKDTSRMNVALTRAKQGLVVVGDARTLGTNEAWGAWLRSAQTVDVKASDESSRKRRR